MKPERIMPAEDRSVEPPDPELEREFLKVIVEYCGEIQGDIEYFGGDEEDFLSDRRYQRSVCMSIFQIGENVKSLRKSFADRYDTRYWKRIAGMRDVIGHSYNDGFDMNRAWDIASSMIGELYDICIGRLVEIEIELGPDPNLKRVDDP